MFIFPLSSAHGQAILTWAGNDFREGESLMMTPVRVGSVGTAGRNVVWDMSGLTPTGDPVRLSVSEASDSVLSVRDGITVSRYSVTDSTISMSGYENHLTKMTYHAPPLMIAAPLTYGDSLSRDVLGTGVYMDGYTIMKQGCQTLEVDGMGTLVLPGGDTIPGVVRVHSLLVSDISARSSLTSQTGLYGVMEEECHRWHVPGHPCPILEHRSTVVTCDSVRCYEKEEAWLLPQALQFVRPDSPETSGAPPDEAYTDVGLQGHYEVSVTGHQVRVALDFEESAAVTLAVADGTGILYREKRVICTGSPTDVADIDCSGLHRGTYVLYVSVWGKTAAEKITLK